MRRLLALLEVEAGEGTLVGLLWAHSFLMGASLFLFQTSAEAMLVARYGADGLPWIYIGWAVIVPLTGLAYSWLQRRVSLATLWTTALSFSLVVIVGLTVALALSDAAWPVLAVNLAVDVLWALVGLEFWGFAGSVLDLRQAKRLFGLIGSGEVASALVAGTAVGPLLKLVDVYMLFALSAVGLFACLAILLLLLRRHRAALQPEEEDDDAGPSRASLGVLLREPYVRLLVALFFLSMLSFDFLEYVYLDQAGARYGNDPEALATFLGTALAIRQASTLVLKTAVSGRMLGRYGLSLGLTAQPLWQLAGLGLVLLLGAAQAGNSVLFWFFVVLIVADRVLRKAVSKPAEQLLYQPLSRDRRLATHTMMESFVEPLTTGGCGVVLLGLTALLADQPPASRALSVAGVTLGVVAAWLALTGVLRRRYTATLAKALARRDLSEAGLALDAAAVALLEKGLGSRPPGETIYALGLLRGACPRERFLVHLHGLLDAPVPEVRGHVLEHVESLRAPSLLAALLERLERERDDAVLAVLLRALAATGDVGAAESVASYLRDRRPLVRRGAIVALVKHGGLEGFLGAAEPLSGLLRSPLAEERALAAEVLGEVGARGFYRTLLKLLEDESLLVRRAALIAVPRVADPALWPAVGECLAVPGLRAAATQALLAGGEAAASEVERRLGDPQTPPATALRAAWLAARLPGTSPALLARVADPDPELRHQVLESLLHRRHRPSPGERAALEAVVRDEAARAAALAAAAVDVAGDARAGLLVAALEAELALGRDRVLIVLALLQPGPEMLDARRVLGRDGPQARRAQGIEVVDSLCPSALKSVCVPMVEERTAAGLLAKLGAVAPQVALGSLARLRELCSGEVPWLTPWPRACALHVAGTTGAVELADAVASGLAHADARVREAALWSLARLRPREAERRAAPCRSDPAPMVARLARALAGPVVAEGA